MKRTERNNALIKCFIEKQNFPNLLLHGDPFVSRKMVSRLLRNVYSKENYQENVVRYFFMGDDNIKTVRNKLYEKVMFKTMKRSRKGYPGFKTIIIEQAGKISQSIQNILWDLLEKNLNSTRFILITSRLYGVIPLIRERCYDIYVGTSYVNYIPIINNSVAYKEATLENAQRLYDNGVSPDALIAFICEQKTHTQLSAETLVELAVIDGRIENLDDRVALLAILKILSNNNNVKQ